MHHLVKRVSCPYCGHEQNIRLRVPSVGFGGMPEQNFKCINTKCPEHFSANLLEVFKSTKA